MVHRPVVAFCRMDAFVGGDLALGPGWQAFGDQASWLRYASIFLLASASGAALAYHPVYRGRPVRIRDLELRRTLLIYSVVGALIAVVCATAPSMAFVIFGIGGLMRFRTDVGESKHTGQAIVASLVGLCWGLQLQMVAVFATVYFWVLIYLLERSPLHELIVGGVAVGDMTPSASAYRKAIEAAGGRVTAHDKNFKKQQMAFAFRAPSEGLAPVVESVERIPEGLRGAPHWPE